MPNKTAPKTSPANRTRDQQTRGRGHQDGQKPQGKSQGTNAGSQQESSTRARQGG